ncbi:MAG: glycosyl transferase family 1 [Phenylobacterium sp.]|uniref:glycosyl transferase family 1 n=1 Tax=Phenylobacterium sp. TaxID=1871053 RepID=UPI00391D85A9
MKLAYFVHDLGDAAVARRTEMLQKGGARVTVLGFRRTESAPESVAGATAVDLGRSYDARLAHRALAVARETVRAGRLRDALAGAEVVVARNLEMLTVAERARRLAAPAAALAYECLDIHRAMLSTGAAGRLLRAHERRLLQQASLLIVSSPAFLEAYFDRVQHSATPSLLVENKVLVEDADALPRPAAPAAASGPPWRIGWFGVIRCRRSLEILAELVRSRPDLAEVVIRGRPARHEFDDFDRTVAETPGLSFQGAYAPADLPRIYGEVHFTWAIDYFEAGQNSEWLLPNRLYEGGLHGAPPIALASVQTGRWLAAHGAGLLLQDPETELAGALGGMTPERYSEFFAATACIPVRDLAADAQDCRGLVERLAQARP